MWVQLIMSLVKMMKARKDAKRSGGNKGQAMGMSMLNSYSNTGGFKGGQTTGNNSMLSATKNNYSTYNNDDWFKSA